MKKFAVAILIFSVGLTMGVAGAFAQGPAGAGAGAPTVSTANTSSASSHSSHSYNPIRWVKKGHKNSSEAAPEATADRDKALTAKLQSQGVLPQNTTLTDACSAFKGTNDCVAALHASHNLSLDFSCVKSNVTGVLVSADASACKQASSGKASSLANAIHALKPEANAKAEAKNAEKQAAEDLKS